MKKQKNKKKAQIAKEKVRKEKTQKIEIQKAERANILVRERENKRVENEKKKAKIKQEKNALKKAKADNIRKKNKLEKRKAELYEKIKRLNVNIKFTGNVDVDIRAFLSYMQKRKTVKTEENNEMTQKKKTTNKIVVSTRFGNSYDFNRTVTLAETHTIKKQTILYGKPRSKNNQSAGMAFDKFEYGLD